MRNIHIGNHLTMAICRTAASRSSRLLLVRGADTRGGLSFPFNPNLRPGCGRSFGTGIASPDGSGVATTAGTQEHKIARNSNIQLVMLSESEQDLDCAPLAHGLI